MVATNKDWQSSFYNSIKYAEPNAELKILGALNTISAVNTVATKSRKETITV